MAGEIYKKPIAFTLMVTLTVLAGSIVMMAYPMLRADMHPKLETLKPFTPLQLAGRDLYQREGCVNCHTQTVRPLKSEVMRYGDYSKAGEFYYDRPFLWGSKRTGPDLAREGGMRPDAWHLAHFVDPQSMVPRSNMPAYRWLKEAKVDAAATRRHLQALALPFTDDQIKALEASTELEAMVAYMQWLGTGVPRKAGGLQVPLDAVNPLAGNPAAIARGQKVYADNCAVCHQDDLAGMKGAFPGLLDPDEFLEEHPDAPDGAYYALVFGGSDAKPLIGRKGYPDGGMTAFGAQLSKDDIWSVIAYIRSERAKQRK
jgi:cytochrome c oxidase cbb3-type subunit 2